MATPESILRELVQLFVTNETEGGLYPSLAATAPGLSADEAYQVQQRAIAELKRRGSVGTGKKIAATNDATQQMLGLSEPAYGELLDEMAIPNGGSVSIERFANGRVECELAFVLGKSLTGGQVGPADILAATDQVVAAFELADLRNQGWDLSTAEVICYDGLAKHYVLAETGVRPETIDLIAQSVTLSKDDELVATGTGAAALGDPLVAMAWLANKLISQGRSLHAGEIVLTGSLTPPLPMAAGERFAADFPGLGAVSVEITG